MSVDVYTREDVHGEFVATIEIRGAQDILRFADRMLEWQVDFGHGGRRILQELRRHLGAARFDGLASHLGLRQSTVAASKRPRASV